ncbi:Rieske 2Fe-2S domain-containing protein [Nevskia ramosa]|uniref:Rieske 2Fe-2S domain-containing protein n=1 Tax=Nevskia ramosa TaxID=64002 RepID=UPI0025F667E8|nr:Rieske 2Fe-2S domain-containing protein [uncultured Nevskia sp.]
MNTATGSPIPAHVDPLIVWKQTDQMQVPYQVFTDPRIFNSEQERIFRGPHWSFLGLEAEMPEPNDFKATYLGDTPVVVTRDRGGVIHAWVNRCAHRGAMVCRDRRGNADAFTCIYHQWLYDAEGNLRGVPFRRGLGGEGGMPSSFDMKEHRLPPLRVATYCGLIFASFARDSEVESLETYLGAEVCAMLDRIFGRPIELLGDERQVMHANWKLYSENTRDAYHGSLLHLFHATFGLYRSTQKGGCQMDTQGRHSLITATKTESKDEVSTGGLRTYQEGKFSLEDPSLLTGTPDFSDGVSLVILAIFPNLVVHQIANSLAVRQMLPRAVDQMELVWTYFGYADDSTEARGSRLKQMNLVGPGGLISMEDGEAMELVQQAIARDGEATSYIAMGGRKGEPQENLVNEAPIISYWDYYRRAMKFTLLAS